MYSLVISSCKLFTVKYVWTERNDTSSKNVDINSLKLNLLRKRGFIVIYLFKVTHPCSYLQFTYLSARITMKPLVMMFCPIIVLLKRVLQSLLYGLYLCKKLLLQQYSRRHTLLHRQANLYPCYNREGPLIS